MTQWPEDKELSRLYREIPEVGPGTRLKERVFAAAMEHAASIRNRHAGKHETSAPASPARLFRGWWMPAGLAASVVLSAVSFFLFRSASETQQIVVARQDIPVVAAETAKPQLTLPPRIRFAEVEPAKRSHELPASDSNTEVSESVVRQQEGDAATAQASAGFPDESRKGMTKGRVSPEEKQPKAWLDEIRTLQKSGKSSRAKEQMREFRRKHPDYPLPDDLKVLAVRGL